MTSSAVDPDRTVLYRVGGISAMILGVSYVIITALYLFTGGVPSGGEAWLDYLTGQERGRGL